MGIFSLLLIFGLLGVVFAPSIFVLGYIIKSLIDKKLSEKWTRIASIYMLILIIINVLIIASAAIEAQNSVPDEGGLVFVIFIFVILIESINLFVLRLFYSLYYMHLNKNNSEVDNKKPLKKFIMIILIFLIVIGGFCYISFVDENKNYLASKKAETDIIKVTNINDIPKLDEYKMYHFNQNDVYENVHSENLNGKKIFIKGFSVISTGNSVKNTVKMSIQNQFEPEDVIYNVYFNSSEKFKENSFVYIYGTIKNSEYIASDGYSNEENIVNVIPEKIYYIEENDYSLALSEKYNGKWCLEEKCIEFNFKDSILDKIDLTSKDYIDSYVSFKQYPDNSIFISSYDSVEGFVYLNTDTIQLEVINTYSDYFQKGSYTLVKNE